MWHFVNCLLRERRQPYLLYIALAHMHVPLAPPLPPDTATTAHHPNDCTVYRASLREMDSLVGAVKSTSDDTDKNNTLIWFTGESTGGVVSVLWHCYCICYWRNVMCVFRWQWSLGTEVPVCRKCGTFHREVADQQRYINIVYNKAC